MNKTNTPQRSSLSKFIETGIEKLMDFEKSEALKIASNAIESGNAIMDDLDKRYSIEPISLEQYLNQISPKIDEQIIKHIQESNHTPLGGEIKLSRNINDENVLVLWDFYFTDNNKKMHKIGSKKVIDKDFFIPKDYEYISKGCVFDIDPPKK